MTRYSIAVDPGGQHTGIVLAELTSDGPVPIDGVTLERLEKERDTRHMGCPGYVRRVIAACFAMLEKHGVADDAVQVCVETMVPPTPVKASFVPMAIWRHQLGAWAVLGGVAAVFPDARLIAPAAADHQAKYPDLLWGRTPPGWTAGGSQRQHQRAAWAVLVSGLAQTETTPASAPVVPAPEPIAVPEAAQRRFGEAELVADRSKFAGEPCSEPMGIAVPRLTPVQRVCELVNVGGTMSIGALLDAATQVWPDGTTSDRVALAVAAAMALRPETDRDRMAARLEAKAAELEGSPAEN